MPSAKRKTMRGQLFSAGDSLPVYSGYLSMLQQMLGSKWESTERGVSGHSLRGSHLRAIDYIDPFFAAYARRHVVVLWGGTNDFYYGQPQDVVRDRVQLFCNERRKAGFQTVVTTILPRSNMGTPETFEEERRRYNKWLRSQYHKFAKGLADFGGDRRIGDAGDELDTTYYLDDSVHINTASGALLAAETVYDALRKLL
jgi:hypothetical protein